MELRKSVFNSASERRNFEKLARQWGNRYRLYHNLPFLNVFDISNLVDASEWRNPKKIEISAIDLSRLKKTSIDYTLCDTEDRPLVCVEFDGLQEGFNIGMDYYSDLPSDPWREIIMGLKLNVALGSLFPFFVVGSKYFEKISKDTTLTIVDGIIGSVLASNAAHEHFARGFNPEDAGFTQEKFDELSPPQQHEVIQDWVIGVDVWAQCQHNPIIEANDKLSQELGVNGWSIRPRGSPFAPRAVFYGAEVTVGSKSGLTATGEVMIPNFKTRVLMLSLVDELAKLVALDNLKTKTEQGAAG
jgi:hypothetical protein